MSLKLLLFICLSPIVLHAQGFLTIDSISIEGNHKTRPAWIIRELQFQVGDTISIPAIGPTLARNQTLLMNTSLFSSVKMNIKNWQDNNHASIYITVVEAWYIYPIPTFSLADRNFNVWWKEYDHSLKRAYYGINFYHFNLTGRNDVAQLSTQFGYAQRYEAKYSRPGINRRQTLGFEAQVLYARMNEIAVRTSGDKLDFRFNPNELQAQKFRVIAGIKWRPGLFTTHGLSLERHDNRIADTIAQALNPDYFLQGRNRQQHWSLVYTWLCDRRDIRPYPLHGWRGNIELRQNGLLPNDELHLFRIRGELDKYFSFSNKWSLETVLIGRASLPNKKPPYFNNQAIGYNADFVRGYEYYVSDGLDYGLFKTAFHWQLLNRALNVGKFMPLENYKVFPLKLYLAFNNDVGYANDDYFGERNPSSNRLLWGYGLGLDIVAYYDKVAQLEWSWNDLGENGFYIHLRTAF